MYMSPPAQPLMDKMVETLVIGGHSLTAGGSVTEVGEGSGSSDVMRSVCVGKNNRGVTHGYATSIGRRDNMEDSLTIHPKLLKLSCIDFGGCQAPNCDFASQQASVHYYGVFDGHGGTQVSHYCAKELHGLVAGEWERDCEAEWSKRWEAAFSKAYAKADNAVCNDDLPPSVGSTALVAVLSACQIIVANCGDSRAVICRGNQAIPLTIDHKLNRKDEADRICEAGGKVLSVGCLRVDGVLAMTRAIGDQNLKPMVVPVPEVTFMVRCEKDECLILASDGVWDVMSNEEAAMLARRTLRHYRKLVVVNESSTRPAQHAAEIILEKALLAGSSDNVAVIVIDLKFLKKKRQTATPETELLPSA